MAQIKAKHLLLLSVSFVQAVVRIIEPSDPRQPLTVLEVQFQEDATVYQRIVTEMAALQAEHPMRAVQGVILFRWPHLDPRTEPWTKVVQGFLLRDVLARLAEARPDHPLLAVFQPVLVSNQQTLQQNVVQYYRQITNSSLPDPLKATLVAVFNWLEQRLPHMSKQERIESLPLARLKELLPQVCQGMTLALLEGWLGAHQLP